MERNPKKDAARLSALGVFAGGIAHDVNNILSVIDAHARLALAGGQGDIGAILAAAERGAGLTRRLLAFSAEGFGVEEPVDAGGILRRAAPALAALLGAGVRLDLSLSSAFVMASDDCLTQIAANLAQNARDAMGGEGAFAVSCHAENGRAVLAFRDTGPGIAPSRLPHIFDPFFTTRPQAAGLGLSVVHGIVTRLGGEVSARTEKGGGACSTVTLPLTSARPRDAADVSLQGRTLLLAEDEPALRSVLALSLRNIGMEVLEAANGNLTLELQRGHGGDIDILLADIAMPGMDGREMGEKFAAERPAANVVFMSGHPFAEIPAGADFILKPLGADRLEAILKRALERRDARLRGENPENGDDDLQ